MSRIKPLLRTYLILIACLVMAGILCNGCQSGSKQERMAKRITDRNGISGGLIVHYECGGGQLTAALKRNERFTVHGLDRDEADIAAARAYIESSGLDADVTVMRWEASVLPYTDRLVNLFIAEDTLDIPMQEVMRVLVPGGVALIKGKKTIKPWPGDIDEWNQTRYDYTSNGVSSDAVGPPKHIRWTAGPLHSRSHEENSSTMALVTANGRMFYIQDEGLIGVSDSRLPSMWTLIARDAFNGRLLWKSPIPEWGWQVWEPELKKRIWTTLSAQRHQFPAGMARRLIARGDKVYMTLGYRAPVSVIDAATGSVIRTLAQTDSTDEIVLVDDILLTLKRDLPARDRSRKDPFTNNTSTIQAIDTKNGKTLWSVQGGYVWQWSMVSDGERVFYYDADSELIHAVDLKSGKSLWQTSSEREEIQAHIYIGKTFLVKEGLLFYMGPARIQAYDAATGDSLWAMKGKGPGAPVYHNQPSMFVADGLFWPGGPSGGNKGDKMTGYDPRTGEAVRILEPGYLLNKGHHYRCFPPRATEQFLIIPRRGAEFMDLQGNVNSRNDWLRGACRFGYIPSDGLFYVTPHQCFCYTGVLVNGFNAFASDHEQPGNKANQDIPRLVTGPAYQQVLAARDRPSSKELWPMYRHDNERSGKNDAEIPAELTRLWEIDLEGDLKQPVIAEGKLFITDKSKNRIICLAQEDGSQLWQFIADTEVDSPPTWHKGFLYFGCTDGCLYCVDAENGLLAWRYRIAPEVRLIVDESRLQSSWPVHGSVIVLNNIVYAAAGRSSFLDGGIYLAGIDAYSGEQVHSGQFEGPYPDLEERATNGYDMEGGNNDLLVTDGQFIYLRQNKFDLDLNHIPIQPIDRDFQPRIDKSKYRGIKGDRDVGLHLMATGGFLDETFFNRNFWIYSERWPGFYFTNQSPRAGQLITFDEQNTYAVKHYPRRNIHSPLNIPEKDGYLVFADPNDTPMNLYDDSDETEPIDWLPTAMKVLQNRKLISEEDIHYPTVNFDKGAGFTRRTPPLWMEWHPVRFMAMSQAGNQLVLCGVPDKIPEEDPMAAFEGRMGSRLVILGAEDGKTQGVFSLDEMPVFDGISIGNERVFMVTAEGSILSFGKATK